jgi:hypothetical protein
MTTTSSSTISDMIDREKLLPVLSNLQKTSQGVVQELAGKVHNFYESFEAKEIDPWDFGMKLRGCINPMDKRDSMSESTRYSTLGAVENAVWPSCAVDKKPVEKSSTELESKSKVSSALRRLSTTFSFVNMTSSD